MKVYLLHYDDLTPDQRVSVMFDQMTKDEFINLSIETGNAFSLDSFENYFNHDEHFDFINTHIRFYE